MFILLIDNYSCRHSYSFQHLVLPLLLILLPWADDRDLSVRIFEFFNVLYILGNAFSSESNVRRVLPRFEFTLQDTLSCMFVVVYSYFVCIPALGTPWRGGFPEYVKVVPPELY